MSIHAIPNIIIEINMKDLNKTWNMDTDIKEKYPNCILSGQA